jgi:hypothetical protein
VSKFVENVVHLCNTNKMKVSINGKPYNKALVPVSGIALETAAIAVAVAAVAVAVGTYGIAYFFLKSLRGEKMVLGGRAYGTVEDTDWRFSVKIGGEWYKDDVNKAFTKNGEILVFCDPSVEADLRASLDASGKASWGASGGASDDSFGGAAPQDETAAESASDDSFGGAAPPAGDKSEEKPQEKPQEKPKTALQIRHEAEEEFVATVLAAESLGIPVEAEFRTLRDVFLALSCARDEEAKPEAFASLNKARGEALRMVFAIGSSSVPEVQEAFVAYTVAAVKAREEKEKGKAASAA